MIAELFEQIECLHEIEGVQVVHLTKFIEGLSAIGYKDLERPKSKKNFDFKMLDLRSIRLMNRLANLVMVHLEGPMKQLALNGKAINKEQFQKLMMTVLEKGDLFQSSLKKALIRIGVQKEERLNVILTEDFFRRLSIDLQIKKSTSEHTNLSKFLCLDQIRFSQFILLKKLSKALEVFIANHYLKSLGTKVSVTISIPSNYPTNVNLQKNDLTSADEDQKALIKINAVVEQKVEESDYYSEVDEQ